MFSFGCVRASKTAEGGLGRGKTTGDLGDISPPVESRGGASVWGLGTKSPEAEEF